MTPENYLLLFALFPPLFFFFFILFFLAWDHLETNGFDLISKTTYEACFC